MDVPVRTPPRWAQLLPAGLSVVAASALAYYLLFTPLVGGPRGPGGVTTNAFVAGYAAFVLGTALAGAIGAYVRRERVVWTASGLLALVGSVPLAVGPQVWVVAILLAVAALLGRTTPDDSTWVGIAAVLFPLLGGLLWLTAITGPTGSGVIAVFVFLGAGLSLIGALDRSDDHRYARIGAVVLLVGVVVLVAAVTVGSIAPPEPRVTEFESGPATCVDHQTSDESVVGTSTFGRSTISVTRSVNVSGTGYELREPTLERVDAGNYTLEIEPESTGVGADCLAEIEYTVTVLLPRVGDGPVRIVVVEDGTPVVEISHGPRETSGGTYPLDRRVTLSRA